MPYIKTFDRNQIMFCTWDDFVEPDSDARLIDAFVNSLDLSSYGVKEVSAEGRPAYDPRGLYKLYIYGNRHGIRSSRKLAFSCVTNIEVKWLMGGVEPDFRTISDFRKDNIDSLKEIFHEFNRRLAGEVEWGFVSVDGSKFQASNSKDNNFTRNKLDDRIKRLNDHVDEYLRILKEMDVQEEAEESGILTKKMVEERLEKSRERLARYEGYQKLMEKTGVSQLSLTDADAKLMKNKNGFGVSYNVQTAVDSNTHLIRDYQLTNRVTDHGLLGSTLEGIRAENPDEVITAVADKGYNKTEDMEECLENGIVPNVIPDDGKDGYELEVGYEDCETDPSSTNPEELGKCLRAGIVPDAYKDIITDIKVEEVTRKVQDEKEEIPKSLYGTVEEMKTRASEGYFVRDPEANIVYCPAGETLRQKSIKKDGDIRYCNKTACKHCQYRNKCYKGKGAWKEIDFTKDTLEKPCRDWLRAAGKEIDIQKKQHDGRWEKKTVVKFFFRPDREKTAQRMCVSEHPFGTIKRAHGATYFLLRSIEKVSGEFALMCLGYNLVRGKKLLGFNKMMEIMAKA